MSLYGRIGSSRSAPLAAARISAVLALAAALSGCLYPQAQWSPTESPKRNTVQLIRLEHTVAFRNGETDLGTLEREKLQTFLERVRAGYGDDIVVSAMGRVDTARDTAIAERRIEAVASILKEDRLRHIVLSPGGGDQPWDGSVHLTLTRYLVLAPECPDWTKPGGSDWTNAESSNLGCATTTNLGLMLADPGDLVRTRPLTEGDGQRGALQVRKYRAGATSKASASTTSGGE